MKNRIDMEEEIKKFTNISRNYDSGNKSIIYRVGLFLVFCFIIYLFLSTRVKVFPIFISIVYSWIFGSRYLNVKIGGVIEKLDKNRGQSLECVLSKTELILANFLRYVHLKRKFVMASLMIIACILIFSCFIDRSKVWFVSALMCFFVVVLIPAVDFKRYIRIGEIIQYLANFDKIQI